MAKVHNFVINNNNSIDKEFLRLNHKILDTLIFRSPAYILYTHYIYNKSVDIYILYIYIYFLTFARVYKIKNIDFQHLDNT
jgi:hypothetical protein